MIKVILFGARGRMGRMVAADLISQDNVSIIAGVEIREHPDINSTCEGVKIIADSSPIPQADVWVDFSLADAAVRHAQLASKNCVPLVIGATGFSSEQLDKLKHYSNSSPLLLGSNFSIGIGVMQQIVSRATYLINHRFEVSLSEQHHNKKLDRPSGTAKDLIQAIKSNGNLEPQVASFRVGGAIGEHQVRFVGDHEELVITHRAFSRKAFSQGVIRAVEFILQQKSGLYSVQNLFNDEPE